MTHQVTHPSKEQVRAYMNAREANHRPPPAPDEIRRQLGWQMHPGDDDRVLVEFYLIPSTCGQMAARIALNWYFASVRAPFQLPELA